MLRIIFLGITKSLGKRAFSDSLLELIVRLTLGVVFLFACYHKITDPARFAKVIYGYGLFPASAINLIAIIMPFVELYAGLALVLGIYPRAGAVAVNTMLLAFIISITINLIRGHEFDCGCFSFGGSVHISNMQLLVRDVILFLMGLDVLLFNQGRMWCIRQGR
ncbi:MauE (modular protein) [uncultured Desulfobacterium sp.]|uniref:MauE (Modular protein) n=1 Tax=uncultured Desulfobacterium sp. TaxID=201089 RepID=A0A445MVN8_9BACT|nr:MauE (modular protein) [uncultured Desulfobacterium sp.]